MGVVDLSDKLRLALGTVKDRASIGKARMVHKSAEGRGFSHLEIAVVRATGHHHASNVDDKHMHEILFLATNSPGSIPFLAERISRRLAKTRDRLVALKTLLLVHRLLRGGNRYFEHQLRMAHASGHLQLAAPWFAKNPADHSVYFLHKYSAYLEERIGWVINQAGKLEPLVMNQGLEFGSYDEKSVDLVFRRLPKCQAFMDRVLESCCPFAHLPCFNTLYRAAMTNTLKESFQVYATYCECVAALMNMFFDLTAGARALACRILRRASMQSGVLQLMYDTCEKVIGNKNLEYPVVQIMTLEHVAALEQVDLEAGSSSPPPVLGDGVKDVGVVRGDEDDGDGDLEVGDSSGDFGALFSWKSSLETKISTVWVVFEDEFSR
ncbi:unnamed protein product [Linum trigynum]